MNTTTFTLTPSTRQLLVGGLLFFFLGLQSRSILELWLDHPPHQAVAVGDLALQAAAAVTAPVHNKALKTDFQAPDPEWIKGLSAAPISTLQFQLSVAFTGNIYFEFREDKLTDSAKESLEELVKALKAQDTKQPLPAMFVEIQGYSDISENDPTLAERRALAVRELLFEEGIPLFRISTISWGSQRPIAKRGSPENQHAFIELLVP